MTRLEDMKTLAEMVAELNSPESLERQRKYVASLPARKRRARIRSDNRWQRDPVMRCERCKVPKGTELEIRRLCAWRQCAVILCGSCKTYIVISFGPVGCSCDKGGGHNTYAEMPKPSGKRKLSKHK